MGSDPNVGRQSFMNGLLTQVEPSVLWLSLIHSLANEYPLFYEEALRAVNHPANSMVYNS